LRYSYDEFRLLGRLRALPKGNVATLRERQPTDRKIHLGAPKWIEQKSLNYFITLSSVVTKSNRYFSSFPRVEWILSAADPQTLGEEAPQNAIKFSGRQGFRQLGLYFRDSLNAISGDLTGCISHHHLVFAFGRVRLRSPATGPLAETNIAAKITFQGSKIIKAQIRISWPLVFDP
jgi:hypothetical protein